MKPGLPRHLTRVVRALSKSQKCSPEVFCQRHPNFGLKSRSLRKQVAFFRVHGCIKQDGRLDPPPRPTVMSPRICALLAVLSEIFEGSFVPKILSALFLSAPSKLQGLTIPSCRSIAELSSTLKALWVAIPAEMEAALRWAYDFVRQHIDDQNRKFLDLFQVDAFEFGEKFLSATGLDDVVDSQNKRVRIWVLQCLDYTRAISFRRLRSRIAPERSTLSDCFASPL